MPDFTSPLPMKHYGVDPTDAVLGGASTTDNIMGKFVAHPDDLPTASNGNLVATDAVGINYISLIPR